MGITHPLVSVCIPTFNGAMYLEQCLSSISAQTFENLEVIISDDASTDSTLDIISDFKENTTLEVSIYNHEPSGIGANWNNCIKHAKGTYIKFLFQDDVLYPTCIAQMVASANIDSKVGLVYAKRDFMYKESSNHIKEFIAFYSNLHIYWKDITIQNGILEGTAYLRDSQILNSPKNKIGEPTSVLIKKECFNKVGLFNEDMKQALDCEFWYRLMPYYKIGFVDEVLSGFRLHPNQASAKNKSQLLDETRLLYKVFYDKLYPYLHKKNQWKLKKLFHPLYSFLMKLKNMTN